MEYLELVQKAKSGEITIADFANYIVETDKRFKRNEKAIGEHSVKLNDIDENLTILPAEATDFQNEVRRKGVQVLGGKNARAYKNASLRSKVYRDIHFEVKRQYGLITDTGRQMSFTKLKRKYANSALNVIRAYEPPIAIANEIDAENDLDGIDE